MRTKLLKTVQFSNVLTDPTRYDQVDPGQPGGEHGLQVQRQAAGQTGGDAGAYQVRGEG